MNSRGRAHGPVRPSWDCACAARWPCPREMYVLIWSFRGHIDRLNAYLTGQLDLAISDLSGQGIPLPDLDARIRGWVPAAAVIANRSPSPGLPGRALVTGS